MTQQNPTDLPDPSQPPQPEVPPAPPRRKRWWLRIVLAVLILIILLVVFLPQIASLGFVRSIVVGKVNENLNGKVAIADWSLGWTGGVDVKGMNFIVLMLGIVVILFPPQSPAAVVFEREEIIA